jgi:hypothetical protein
MENPSALEAINFMTAMIHTRKYKPLLSFYHLRNEMNTEPEGSCSFSGF